MFFHLCLAPLYVRGGQLIFRKISKNRCHRMSDFKAKMHQILFPLAFRPAPDPAEGSIRR